MAGPSRTRAQNPTEINVGTSAFGLVPPEGKTVEINSPASSRVGRKDAVAALRWVETLPTEIQKFGLRSLTNDGGNPTTPATALDLYAQIRDPALRAEFVTTHARDWLVTDRPAATAWLEKSDALTPEQAAALLAPAPTAK